MNVDIEFFSDDPMDNVLACTKFQFDKVIFLGYAEEDMDRAAKSTVAAFLKKEEIGVKELEFVPLPEGRLDDIEKKLVQIVEKEKDLGNQCFFDLTGGEELVLAAAGMVADEKNLPMHEIDLAEDEVRIQSLPEAYEQLPKRDYRLNIEEYLNLHEGVIEWRLQKSKNQKYNDEAHKSRMIELNRFMETEKSCWNKLSQGLAYLCSKQDDLICGDSKDVAGAARIARMSVSTFIDKLKKMKEENILQSLLYSDGIINLAFYNDEERNILCDPGAILEHITYWQIVRDPEVNDCAIGYHINWIGDGDPNSIYRPGPDVVNEIDIIYMKKNIPTFISCKNKMVSMNQPLYELETVADRFGGTLVRKVLVAKKGVSPGIAKRAKEMDIEVVKHL
ncbi:hypothetical protein D081_1364 [Anaerovibrio sp. JC8]|uniref:Card1-like endonuclease domain-containing protein n=1 Tax=Anaerovibrio sp. JC8 TaxID=1240085 RepID=UPI000A0E93D1|nr:DUF1887 family CARF protein [Anaerovibrio sp. JC8]ORU00270.1 hypothetical protein D081_1364 [Anaerovibrio sp. JC8]